MNQKHMTVLQSIVCCLNHYAQEIKDGPEVLEKVFFIALEFIEESVDTIGYIPINQNKVTKLILHLTDCKNKKSKYHVHNNIVVKILQHIVNPDTKLNKEVLVKSLPKLRLKIESEAFKDELLQLADEAIDAVSPLRK